MQDTDPADGAVAGMASVADAPHAEGAVMVIWTGVREGPGRNGQEGTAPVDRDRADDCRAAGPMVVLVTTAV